MRTLGVIVLLFAALLVIVSCSVEKPLSSTERPPEPTASQDVPTTTAKVAAWQIGDEYDEASGEVTNQATTFSPDTPAIHVRAELTGLEMGVMVHCILRAVEVTGAEGNVIQDTNMGSWQLPPTAEDCTLYFEFTPPEEAWAVGTYMVDIRFQGELLVSTDIAVE